MKLNNLEKFREKLDRGQFCVGAAVGLADATVADLLDGGKTQSPPDL